MKFHIHFTTTVHRSIRIYHSIHMYTNTYRHACTQIHSAHFRTRIISPIMIGLAALVNKYFSQYNDYSEKAVVCCVKDSLQVFLQQREQRSKQKIL